ncbi:glycosyl transferase [bacterium]|nr:glycosyl transferase [bacterium]MBU1957641.1 glycosyl transferase [bacterium]
MNFLPYIKAVGTGKKRNRDLNKDEMKIAMRAILNSEVAPEQVSAFLLGWRVKGESIDEFKGAIEAFDEFIKPHPIANSIEFGYPYDGKVKNPYLFPLMAKYLKPYGIQLSFHGDVLQPAKGGVTLKEICTHTSLEENIHFFDRATYFKELHQLSQIRNTLGIRSSFNTLEKLLGISQSDTAIIGAFHKPFIDKYIELFKDRYKKLIIVKGNEGTPEIFSKCSIFMVENAKVEEIKVDPKALGIDYEKSWKPITLEESLTMIKNPSNELEKLAEFNAKVILFLMNKTKTLI